MTQIKAVSNANNPHATLGARQPGRHLRIPAQIVVDLLRLSDVAVFGFAALVVRAVTVSVLAEQGAVTPFLVTGLASGVLFAYAVPGHRNAMEIAGPGAHSRSNAALTGAALLAVLVLLSLGPLELSAVTLPKRLVAACFFLGAACVAVWRLVSSWCVNRAVRRGLIERRVFVLAAAEPNRGLLKVITETAHVRLVGQCMLAAGELDTSNAGSAQAPHRVTGISQVIAATRSGEVDEVVVDTSAFTALQLKAVVARLSDLPLDIRLWTSALDVEVQARDVASLDRILHTFRRQPMQAWSGLAKRMLDIVGASMAFVLLTPLFVLIALAIKCDSAGPVLFRQRRYGYNQREFRVLKFRTMSVMEDGPHVEQARPNDQRITRVGNVLRRTSLDELPQLVNVLKGEMSLVGPRPHAIAHDHLYGALIVGYSGRHRVKPGITGLAQIRGLRGETRDVELMHRRVGADVDYIDHWSIGLDIRILALTLVLGFVSLNAR